ncbi:MAG: 1-acyl-sn-glycerol-3-phosphate acyltransferase [Clostridia bacterium]|nr:1-acyl-sn-glycerol-3-phosphate acyltransferase [Clostridia bacterium]
MYYRHNLQYNYPEKPDQHMITVNPKRKVVLDQNYPYYNKSFVFKLGKGLFRVLLSLIIFPLMLVTHGLKIYGKKNLRRHKKILKEKGAISICNHTYMWDYLAVLKAIRPRSAFIPVWQDNIRGGFGLGMRWAGAIPIPTDSYNGMKAFKKDLEQVFNEKKWVHFFPEGSMWFFYPDVRPFKKAVFHYAVKYDRPIVPIAMTFRDRKGLLKLFGKTPMIDCHIGEPIWFDKSLPTKEAEIDLHKRAYKIMQEMCGVKEGDKTYNPDYNPKEYIKTM